MQPARSTRFHFRIPKTRRVLSHVPENILKEGNDSKTFCKKLLREAKVSATPGVDFGPTGEGHMRLSFCVPEEMIHKAFDRMEEYFKEVI